MFPRIPPLLPWDKIAHAGEWAIWSALCFAVLRRQIPRLDLRRAFLWTLTAAAVLALLHELYQIPVPGRSCDPADWFADMIGAILAATVCMLLASRFRRIGF